MARYSIALVGLLLLGCGGDLADGAPAQDGGADMATDATGGQAADAWPEGAIGSDSAVCEILPSSYDPSCATDTDCVAVSFGDYCADNQCFCGGGAINRSSLAQFNADVAKTPVGSGAVRGVACPCVPFLGPCCRSGSCTSACSSPSDTLAACADAGGSCAPPGATCPGAGGSGPANSCAYPDETCCLR